jgi:hypothetical protein
VATYVEVDTQGDTGMLIALQIFNCKIIKPPMIVLVATSNPAATWLNISTASVRARGASGG